MLNVNITLIFLILYYFITVLMFYAQYVDFMWWHICAVSSNPSVISQNVINAPCRNEQFIFNFLYRNRDLYLIKRAN